MSAKRGKLTAFKYGNMKQDKIDTKPNKVMLIRAKKGLKRQKLL